MRGVRWRADELRPIGTSVVSLDRHGQTLVRAATRRYRPRGLPRLLRVKHDLDRRTLTIEADAEAPDTDPHNAPRRPGPDTPVPHPTDTRQAQENLENDPPA